MNIDLTLDLRIESNCLIYILTNINVSTMEGKDKSKL